jgi:hypothetical protein
MNMPMSKFNTQASSHSWWNQKSSHKFETQMCKGLMKPKNSHKFEAQMCGGLFHDFLYNGHKHNTKLIWSHATLGPKSSFIPHWKPFFIFQVMHPISQD